MIICSFKCHSDCQIRQTIIRKSLETKQKWTLIFKSFISQFHLIYFPDLFDSIWVIQFVRFVQFVQFVNLFNLFDLFDLFNLFNLFYFISFIYFINFFFRTDFSKDEIRFLAHLALLVYDDLNESVYALQFVAFYIQLLITENVKRIQKTKHAKEFLIFLFLRIPSLSLGFRFGCFVHQTIAKWKRSNWNIFWVVVSLVICQSLGC